MIKGKTSGGFEFEIDGSVLEDMEFVDALAETVNDNPLAFSNVCVMLFGKEQRKHVHSSNNKIGASFNIARAIAIL